jgi:hypothetical protein
VPLVVGATVLILTGLLGGLIRRIPLHRCARAVDRAVAGDDGRNGDRTLAALSLMSDPAQASSPMVEAAIADAARAARGREIAGRAAPWRRPRGLGVAATLAAVTLVASWWPSARPTGAPVQAAPLARKGERIDPRLLAAERVAATAASAQAAAARDAELARLAGELQQLLDGMAEGQVDRAEALDRLARLAKEAADAARDGRASQEMLRAAAEALEREKQARALAEAMQKPEEEAGKKAAEALAEKASQMSSAQRDRLAEALGKAASAGARASDEAQREEGRRLGSPAAANGGQGESGARDRQLKRLERDLSDGADRCREDPEACRQALNQVGADLPQVNRDARQSSSRDRLGKAIQQLRERMKRQGQSGPDRAEDEFEQAAGGMRPMPGQSSGGDEGQPGSGAGTPSGGPSMAGAQAPGAGAEAKTNGGAAEGEGMGNDPGGDPLGARERPAGARGQQHEARLRDGAGPSRAEVIESGAHKGFARGEYQRVFQDYSAAVEETLDTTAVPPSRRYLVRRYFQLIRPREEASGGR